MWSLSGSGPFPGIIDLYGTGGGLPEYRASLLANHGFAVLALAFYSYEDLPKGMKEFHLEYFEEAVNYMLQHTQVGLFIDCHYSELSLVRSDCRWGRAAVLKIALLLSWLLLICFISLTPITMALWQIIPALPFQLAR